MKNLRGSRALITGASSGLGEEFAKQLAARGCDLVIAARRFDRLETLASALSQRHGVEVESLESDLSRAGGAADLFEKTRKGGPVDILINNAGIGPYGKFLSNEARTHSQTVQLNVLALTELSHFFAAHMLEHGKNSYIVNVGSIASFQGVPNFAVYAATKHYVRVFSEILAHELDQTKVRVTCVCPGGTLTEFSAANGQQLNDSASSFMMTAERVVQIALEGIFAGKRCVVPGFTNKLACFLPRMLPSSLSLSLAAMAMSRNVSSVVDHAPQKKPGEKR